MKKKLLISSGIILVAIWLIILSTIYKFDFTHNSLNNDDKPNYIDYKNTAYLIEGQSVTLKNGSAESELAPDSASKSVTKYFGNDASGDLNGDVE